MQKVDYSLLGNKVRYFRKQRRLTQQQLADMVGLTQKHISNIERAYSIPSLQTLVNICNTLEVPPNQFLMESLAFSYPNRDEEVTALIGRCNDAQLSEVLIYLSMLLKI